MFFDLLLLFVPDSWSGLGREDAFPEVFHHLPVSDDVVAVFQCGVGEE